MFLIVGRNAERSRISGHAYVYRRPGDSLLYFQVRPSYGFNRVDP